MPVATEPAPFRYPPTPHVRRHGPCGYADLRSYRPWLRDEFSFRCVYCLIRESWGRFTSEFDLDHFVPQVQRPDLPHDYDNLLYACHVCNLRKSVADVPDASIALTAQAVCVYPDGSIVGLLPETERVIRVLSLNSPQMRRWRRTWIRIVDLASTSDPELFKTLMGYPEDVPDLSAARPANNTRPNGVAQSIHARRQRGELEDIFYH